MTVVVLLTVVWTGICTPDWIEAGVFVSAATFGEEMIFSRPWFSAAVSATSRLKVSRMLPSRSWPMVGPLLEADVGSRPSTLFGKIRFVVLPCATSATPLKPQLMPRLRPRRLRRLDDPRLDHDLRGRGVEVVDQLEDRRQVRRDLPDDQGVGARVDDDVAAPRHDALQRRQ